MNKICQILILVALVVMLGVVALQAMEMQEYDLFNSLQTRFFGGGAAK
ncbi:MAG: hypothetical protein MST10_06435 [Lentisphaeria bacterium]|nr:hypothetical protein [Lentisphaeria bacterium]